MTTPVKLIYWSSCRTFASARNLNHPEKVFFGGIIGEPKIFPVDRISMRDYAQLGSIMKLDVDFALTSQTHSPSRDKVSSGGDDEFTNIGRYSIRGEVS
jgi:hypothetical protein